MSLVAILDADKEGFLRSTTSLIQTAGRAARHEKGRVLLYADIMTESLKKTLEIINERRQKQMAYNKAHGITPQGVRRAIQATMRKPVIDPVAAELKEGQADIKQAIHDIEEEMFEAAEKLDFERAAMLRDQLARIKEGQSAARAKKAIKKR